MGFIRYLSKVENAFERARKRLTTALSKFKGTRSEDFEPENGVQEFKSLDNQDTQELNRRYYADLMIKRLSGLARQAAEEQEEWKKKQYERHRNGWQRAAAVINAPGVT